MVGFCLITSEVEFVFRARSVRLWAMLNLTVRWGLSPARWFRVQRSGWRDQSLAARSSSWTGSFRSKI
ncbi:hypothetical protein HA466_0003960 [Hirschfeldia incana]|nr:hypothetical protein HA466_0003960 [Hirschfeldia incana]